MEPATFTKREFADIWSVSLASVDKWVEQGIPREPVGKRRWRYGQGALKWVAKNVRQNGKKPKNGAHEEKTRLEVEKLRLDLDIQKGNHVPVSTFDDVLGDICTRFDSKIQALPRKWAPELLDVEDMGTMVDKLDGLKEELRAELRETGDE